MQTKHVLLWIPKSGLFYDQGRFYDGEGKEIKWGRTIPAYSTHAHAQTAKRRVVTKFPRAQGEVIVSQVKIQEGKEDISEIADVI